MLKPQQKSTALTSGWGRAEWVARQKGRKAILYVIRLYGNDEVFYKVGITFDLHARFNPLKMPYRWRTVARYSSYNAGKVWDLERMIHSAELVPYVPAVAFAGHTECYTSEVEVLALLPAKGLFILKAVNVDV